MMEENEFADVKVHNEIELCQLWDVDIKMKIERAFLANRISYYEKWIEPGFFGRIFGEKNATCILCINSMQAEKAVEIISEMGLHKNQIELINKPIDKTYF